MSQRRFRRIPEFVEAEQWFPGAAVAGVEPFGDPDSRVEREMYAALPPGADPGQYGYLDAYDGGRIVEPGDWIVTFATGARDVYKPEMFERLYEPETET